MFAQRIPPPDDDGCLKPVPRVDVLENSVFAEGKNHNKSPTPTVFTSTQTHSERK